MNLAYIRIELLRQLRDAMNILFVVGLPVAMYILFGTQKGSDQAAGNGNAAFYVMSSMAAYGAITATSTIAGTAATESMQGWGRVVALTRAPRIGYVLNKTAVALVVAVTAVGLVHLVGALTGADSGTAGVWAATAAITVTVLPTWACYGLAAGTWFRSESAVGIASASITFLAFFGNLFIPLSGTMLDIARWTPMYGVAGLVRWPLVEGQLVGGEADELWMLLLNAGVWMAVLAALALLGIRRTTRRQ